MTPIPKQRGSTLLVALIMLVLLTLIAISAMSSTTASIAVVGNAQFREEANSAAQRAIETMLSSGNFKTAQPNQNIDINLDGVADYTVTFDPPPACISYLPANAGDPGVPSVCAVGAGGIGAACFWTVWDITAIVSSVATGANMVVHQGVRTVVGLNAAVASCGV